MTEFSVLCSVCTKALYGEVNPKSIIANDIFASHHPNFTSFLNAVKLSCRICNTVWESMNHQSQNMFTNSDIRDTSTAFRLYRKINECELRLVIIFQWPKSRNGVIETKFELFPCNYPKTKRYFPHLRLPSKTSSSESLDLALLWNQSCHKHHGHCNRHNGQRRDWLPSRLLDIGGENGAQWRLVVVSEDGITNASYITLSYRWGGEQSLMLLSSTFCTFRRGKNICDLPSTFRDAIVVARRFSIRYLWIDALCIIQDCREDWEREIPTMQYIYSNSFCTIAASASENPHGGLFRTRDTTNVVPGVIAAPSGASSNENHYIFDKSYWNREVSNSPLHKRGWVFQERILSPRVVYFGKYQILWECFTELKCEGFPQGIPGNDSLKNFDALWDMANLKRQRRQQHMKMPIHMLRLWNTLIREYSDCALTNASDKLPALLGIANLFQEAIGDQYLAGVWRSRLLEQLDWWVDQPTLKLSTQYRAPSWSWAFSDGPIRPLGVAAKSRFLVSILDVRLQHGNGNLIGAAGSAQLHVLGNLSSSTQLRRPMRATIFPDSVGIEFGQLRPFYFLPLRSASYDAFPDASDHYTPDIYSEVSCLILEAVLCTRPVMFRRVGHCILDDIGDVSMLGLQITRNGLASFQSDSSTKEVVII